jgi:type VI secretion system secreted protein Hcp
MAFDAFMKVAGIPGESTDSNHGEWIEILSFSHGISQPAAVQASAKGGLSTGRVDIQDFSIVKTLDKASPKLALACCKGDHFADVLIELCRSAGDKQKYMEIKLSDAMVSNIRPGGSAKGGEDLPLEEVSFRFGKIEWKYIVLDKKGKPSGNVATGWNLAKNTAV